MPVDALWRDYLLTTRPYPIGGANVASSPVPLPIEITQYAQNDVFDRIIIEVVGNVIVAGSGAGTATGAPNPHGLLNRLNLQTQPQYKSVIPMNNVSARSLLHDAAFARGFYDNSVPIPDVAGTYAVDFFIEMYFKRPKVRKGIQYALNLAKYTSALITAQFGGREQLFTGGTNTWDVSGLSIKFWADSDFAVTNSAIHASELFEQTYAITATQSDYPIDTLPPGFIYTDLMFNAEVNGALSNLVISNIDVEGGGRVWVRQGDNNASFIQTRITQDEFNDQNQSVNGIYLLPLRDGMFTRGIDALTAPITIKLNVAYQNAPTTIRLTGRRMIPGGVQPAPAKKAKQTQKT